MADTFNNFGVIAALIQTKAPRLARQTASDIVTRCRIHSPVLTGRLRDGWDSEQIDDYTGVVFNDVEYAPVIEYGSASGGRPATPMLAPAIDEVTKAFESELAHLLEI